MYSPAGARPPDRSRHPADPDPPERQPGARWRFALLLFGVWTLLAVLNASQDALNLAYQGQAVPWGPIFAVSLLDWYTCAAFTPLILWLVRRHPLRGRAWARRGVLYALAAAAMAVLKYALYVPLRQVIAPIPGFSLAGILADRFFVEFLAFASVIGIALAAEYYRTMREREVRASQLEARLAQAQLDALRAQIRPHFLFNTMNAVSTLMHRDVEAADEMLAQLCDLLRETLDADGVQQVPLRDELRVLDRYLDIMRLRFSDRLTVDVRVHPDVLDEPVPHFILQPLAENAIEHGIARDPRAGRIVVAAERAEGGLRLTVTDDGPGPAGGTAAVREGIGLSNTRERLRQLYGPAATLRLRASPAGTEVELTIPSAAPRIAEAVAG
ncbi:MAG TPA: histidine kinase [Longimicrobium sp.]|nr:histidine kinase [Longimicrobium sp.]